MELNISDKRRISEITAVVFTAIGKFVFMDYYQWRFGYVIAAVVLWMIYIVYRHTKKPGILKYWGFQTENFAEACRRVLPFGLIAVVAFFIIGYLLDTINLTWHIFPILLLYPIWGTIQQFMLISLVAGNMRDMKTWKPADLVIIVLSATLFGLVHYPVLWLMGGTFLLALFYGYMFLTSRNLYALGLFHGWLGALFYYTVLNHDPFQDTLGKLFI